MQRTVPRDWSERVYCFWHEQGRPPGRVPVSESSIGYARRVRKHPRRHVTSTWPTLPSCVVPQLCQGRNLSSECVPML